MMSWLLGWLQGCLTWLAIVIVTVSNSGSSIDTEMSNSLHVTAGNVSAKEADSVSVDPNGYVLFCPCMGKQWEGLK